MSHVEFDKSPSPVALFLLYPCQLYNGPMLHVEFRRRLISCRLVVYPIVERPMSHVKFKKWPCRRVKFKSMSPGIS